MVLSPCAQGPMDCAFVLTLASSRHMRGWHFTQESSVCNAVDYLTTWRASSVEAYLRIPPILQRSFPPARAPVQKVLHAPPLRLQVPLAEGSLRTNPLQPRSGRARMTHLQGECSRRRAVEEFVDSTSVECLFSVISAVRIVQPVSRLGANAPVFSSLLERRLDTTLPR